MRWELASTQPCFALLRMLNVVEVEPAEPFFTRRERKDSAEIVLTQVFIEYVQAVAWRQFQILAKSRSHS